MDRHTWRACAHRRYREWNPRQWFGCGLDGHLWWSLPLFWWNLQGIRIEYNKSIWLYENVACGGQSEGHPRSPDHRLGHPKLYRRIQAGLLAGAQHLGWRLGHWRLFADRQGQQRVWHWAETDHLGNPGGVNDRQIDRGLSIWSSDKCSLESIYNPGKIQVVMNCWIKWN